MHELAEILHDLVDAAGSAFSHNRTGELHAKIDSALGIVKDIEDAPAEAPAPAPAVPAQAVPAEVVAAGDATAP